MAESRKLRFAIIGCGSAAMPIAEALAASAVAELAAVHDLKPELAHDLGGRYGARVHESLDALWDDEAVEAVYIAVPHYQLAPMAALALRAGKHALVEKPMALTLAEADELIALSDGRKLALGVDYQLRHAAVVVQARELVRAGAIGQVIGVSIHTLVDKPASYWAMGYSGRWVNSWRAIKAQAGGGIVLMNSCHALDAVRFITGLEVVSVAGEVGALVAPVEVEDTAGATLRYSNGAIGTLFAGAHLAGSSPGGEHAQIFGTQGQLRLPNLYGDDPLEVYLRRDWDAPPLASGQWHSLPHEPSPFHQRAVDAFAAAALRGAPAPTSGRDARAILAIVLALYEAARPP